mgnify:CR=1 FL=1
MSDKKHVVNAIFKLIKSAKTVDEKNLILPVLADIFCENIECSIETFKKIIKTSPWT